LITGTMPIVRFRHVRLPLGLACAFAALVTAACAASVTGAPSPAAPSATQAAPSASATRPGRPPEGGCRVTVSSTGSISSSGAGGRTMTINGETSFSCGSGPLIGISAIDDSGVTFSVDGVPATVAPGAEGAVGAYRIRVTRSAGGSAEFDVTPTG
jgi:hypothetical protein